MRLSLYVTKKGERRMAPSEIARKRKLSHSFVAACLIVFFRRSRAGCVRLLVVHGVGFAEIRRHHAFVVAASLVVVDGGGGRRAPVVPLVVALSVVVFGGQLFVPAVVLVFLVLVLFPVARFGGGNGSRRGSSLLHLLLVQVVQVVADRVQGLGVDR